MWDVLGLWYVTLIMLCGTFWDPDVGRFGTVVIGTLGSSWHVIIFYCFVISYVISSSPIWLTCYMDRFLKRPRANELSSPNNCVEPSKKPKPCAKQGDVSAAYRAQEFGSHFYESGGKLFCRPCNVVVDHVRKSVVSISSMIGSARSVYE